MESAGESGKPTWALHSQKQYLEVGCRNVLVIRIPGLPSLVTWHLGLHGSEPWTSAGTAPEEPNASFYPLQGELTALPDHCPQWLSLPSTVLVQCPCLGKPTTRGPPNAEVSRKCISRLPSPFPVGKRTRRVNQSTVSATKLPSELAWPSEEKTIHQYFIVTHSFHTHTHYTFLGLIGHFIFITGSENLFRLQRI